MEGVYVIWHGGTAAATVYVGAGKIREWLIYQRSFAAVQAYKQFGLFVTWAAVPGPSQVGVATYLAQRLQPKVVEPGQSVATIEVKLPC
jgi:hypothetical protein